LVILFDEMECTRETGRFWRTNRLGSETPPR
jgi:hypothetical protein